MNGQGDFAAIALVPGVLDRGAVILVVLAYALWRRGASAPLLVRLKRTAAPPGRPAPAGVTVAAVADRCARRSSTTTPTFSTSTARKSTTRNVGRRVREGADRVRGGAAAAHRRTSSSTSTIYPAPAARRDTGTYMIENREPAAPRQSPRYSHGPRATRCTGLDVEGARLTRNSPDLQLPDLRPSTAARGGASAREIRFETVREQQWISATSSNEERIVDKRHVPRQH